MEKRISMLPHKPHGYVYVCDRGVIGGVSTRSTPRTRGGDTSALTRHISTRPSDVYKPLQLRVSAGHGIDDDMRNAAINSMAVACAQPDAYAAPAKRSTVYM